MNKFSKKLIGIVLFLILLNVQIVSADRFPYQSIVQIFDRSENFLVLHKHDWSEKTRMKRWDALQNLDTYFKSAAEFSYIEVIDESTKRLVFKSGVPALTYLWISPDEKHIVCLSNIKSWNPYQLIVFTIDGKLIHKRKIDCTKLGLSCRSSTHNYIRWYHWTAPDLEILVSQKSELVLFVDDLGLNRVGIQISNPSSN